MANLMTPAPILANPPAHRPTGNLFLHLEALPTQPAIERLGVVSLAYNGLLDLQSERPERRPLLRVVGEGWQPGLLADWIPTWENEALRVTLLAPHGERGFALRLEALRPGPIRVEGELGRLALRRFREEGVQASFVAHHDPWTQSYVAVARTHRSVLAMGLQADRPPTRLHWDTRFWLEWEAEAGPITLYLAVAPEPDGARTGALHLRRMGWQRLWQATQRHLEQLTQGYQGPLPQVYRRHLYLAYHYAQADTLEGPPALLTSRSPHYYVSGAYWARDALLWFFPALLQADPGRARQVLRTALERYTPWPGEHAQYVSGPPLYPGFELDQAAAYPLALARYLEAFPDPDLVGQLLEPLAQVFARVQVERHPTTTLFATFLSPTDDPVVHPYLFYDNALWAVALERLAPFLPQPLASQYRQQAAEVRQALFQHGIRAGRMAFSFDPGGDHLHADEPAGSLLILPHLGFVSSADQRWQATRSWLDSPANPYHFPGPFAGLGSAHFPFPSGFDLANRLLLGGGYREQALRTLAHAPLDQGYACESFDPQSGEARTGIGFAAVAGFVAYALRQQVD